MAIIIPSSKIYAVDNPKVRNNVIERIEVYANNASIKNEYDKHIFEEDFDTSDMWTLPNPAFTDVLSYYNYQTTSHSYSSAGGYYVRALGAGVLPIYKELHFEIPKIIGNVLINKVKYGQSNGTNNIKTTITYEYATWNALPTIELINQDASVNESYNRYGLTSLYSYTYKDNKGIQKQELLNLPSCVELQGSVSSMPILSVTIGSDKTNVSTAKVVYNEDKDLYEVDLTILCGFSSFKVAFGKDFVRDENKLPISCGYFSTSGEYPKKLGNNLGYGTVADGIIEEYKPLALNVSFYGNTLELNLKEETLYINGKTAKKVHSVERNELMQTTNYRGSLESLVDDFSRTQKKYKDGKETATIRCSISEYLDENGKLVISSKNADKMLFEHYDKVVPMVRSGRRKELAMSYTADGLAKVFDVVGVRVFFDGAVWQELTLRESGESIDIGRTTYTTIANNAGGLTYKITSNEIVTEENPTRGITYIIGD
jgi:hypothetical protein